MARAKKLGLSKVPIIEAPILNDPPFIYMLRAATKRRHLSDDQRACLAQEEMEYLARLSRQERARAGGKAGGRGRAKATTDSSAITPIDKLTKDRKKDVRTKAAGIYGVSERKINTAQQLKRASPTLYKQVKAGRQRLAVAKRESEREKRRNEHQRHVRTAKRLQRSELWEIRCGDCVKELRKTPPPRRQPPHSLLPALLPGYHDHRPARPRLATRRRPKPRRPR